MVFLLCVGRYMEDPTPMSAFVNYRSNGEKRFIELSGMHSTNEWGLTPVRVSEVSVYMYIQKASVCLTGSYTS